MDWPSNSPDLNPIENLWNIVETNVEKRMPDNRGDLVQFMKEEWGKIPDSVLINLVNSMKTRCELVIEKNGERISIAGFLYDWLIHKEIDWLILL